MSDTSGRMLPTPLAHYDPASLSWRTSQGTFPWEAPQLLETLPAWGMTRGGVLYEHPTPARLTDGRDCSSLLPTPVADHSRGLPQPGTDFQSLPNAVMAL